MNKISLITWILVCCVSACSTQTAVLNTERGASSKDEMQTFFVSGIGQTQTINAAEVCGGTDNVLKVETVYSPLNWGLGLITFGIYTPRDAKVYCK